MDKDLNKEKSSGRRGVESQSAGRGEGAKRNARRSPETKKQDKLNEKNNNHHVDTKGVVIMLAIDILLGVIVAFVGYSLSKSVTDVKTLMMYFGMLALVGVILHVIADLVVKKLINKDEEQKLVDRTTLFLYAAAFLVMVLALSGAFAKIVDDNLHQENIYNGVQLYDTDISGMTYNDALNSVNQKVQTQMEAVNFNVYVDENAYNFNAHNLGMESDLNDKMALAYSYGRAGSVFSRLDQVFALRENPVNFPIVFTPNDTYIHNEANNIANSLYSEVQDATMQFTPWGEEDFIYTADNIGKEIDPEAIVAAVNANCQSMQFSDVNLSTTVTNPTVTLAELQKETELLISYTTPLEDDSNRTSNVDLASTMIEGVIMPDEIFSFNETTGERTREAGFKVAHAIANGTDLIDAVAGGVCQAASTLHAALLHTDVTVLERHNHSFKVSYLSAGMDATVDFYMPLDFKFQNTTGYPLYISCYVTDNPLSAEGTIENTLTVNVYGTNPNPDREIQIRVERLETYAGGFNRVYTDSLPSGTVKYTAPRVSGRMTNTYKDIYINGELVESILVYEKDIYHSVNGTMLVGTG